MSNDRIKTVVRIRELMCISDIESDSHSAVLCDLSGGYNHLFAVVDTGYMCSSRRRDPSGPASAGCNVE